MDEFTRDRQVPFAQPLGSWNYEQLVLAAKQINEQIREHDEQRKREALAEIRRLAKSINKKVRVSDCGRPGRKPKKAP